MNTPIKTDIKTWKKLAILEIFGAPELKTKRKWKIRRIYTPEKLSELPTYLTKGRYCESKSEKKLIETAISSHDRNGIPELQKQRKIPKNARDKIDPKIQR